MAAYSDAMKQSFFHKIVCGGTADSQNVLYLIYGISAFLIANSTLLIYAVQCRDFFFKHGMPPYRKKSQLMVPPFLPGYGCPG